MPPVLFLTLEFPPDRGGVGRYYGEIVSRWPAVGQGGPASPQGGPASPQGGPASPQGGPSGISVVKPRFWALWPRWLPLLWQVGRQVKKERIEMLWIGQVLPLGYVAWWLKKRKNTPYVVFTHGMDVLLPQKSWWKKMWLKKILAGADLVVANSQFTRGEALKLGVEEGRTLVLYPCSGLNKEQETAPSPVLSEAEGLPKGTKNKEQIDAGSFVAGPKKIILSVGRLVKRKGFDKVIEIMPRVLKRVPDAKYVIIGNGPEEENLESEIKNRELSDKVVILKNIGDEELVEWYKRSDVLVMPCRQIGGDVEGFGLVFLEAASFGKPVVAGRSGGTPEAVRHGYSGFVIDPNSEEELYQALVKLLTDEDFASRLGEYGREWVAKKFRWEAETEKLVQRIKNLRS